MKTRTRRPSSVSWRSSRAASRPLSTLPPRRSRRSCPHRAELTAHQGRHADRAGALGDELGPLGEEDHAGGDLVLGHGPQVVEQLAQQRQGQPPGALDGDPVGDRRFRRASGPPGRRGRPRRARRRGPERRSARPWPRRAAQGDRRCPEASPPPPTGTITRARSGTSSSSSSPSVPWPAITSRSSNGCTKAAPLSPRALYGQLEGLVDGGSLQADVGARALRRPAPSRRRRRAA